MKNFTKIAAFVLLAASVSSCATVFGGPVNDYQKTKPLAGQPQREVRAGALIADIVLFWPGAVVDFATGAIYKPQPTTPSPATQPSGQQTGK